MDKASYLLENIQLPIDYHKISPKPSLVDRLVNLVPSSVSLVDQVVNLVSSLVEPLTQVGDLVPSSINPTLHLKSETLVIDSILSSIDLTPPLKSATKVVDLIPSSVDPTPHSKSEDVAQVYLVNIDLLGQGGTLPIPMAPPSSNHIISINWNHLREPRLPSYVPFQISMQVYDRNIPNIVIDKGASISILSANAWKYFGSP
jgi:hypothetical protein